MKVETGFEGYQGSKDDGYIVIDSDSVYHSISSSNPFCSADEKLQEKLSSLLSGGHPADRIFVYKVKNIRVTCWLESVVKKIIFLSLTKITY